MHRGWTIGSGRVKSGDFPDLLISVNQTQDHVRGIHALIYYRKDSGALMIRAFRGKTIFINGNEIREQGQIIPSESDGILIGNLLYKIEYTKYDKVKYLNMRDVLISQSPRSHNDTFESTPGDQSFWLHGYEIEMPSAYGAFGVISKCKSKAGVLLAVKRVRRTKRDIPSINTEIAIMERIGYHDNICSLVEVFYSDGDRHSTGLSEVNDVCMFLTPYASMTATSLLGSSEQLQANFIHQIAEGLHHMHSLKILHRDIKPPNILVKSVEPLHVLIADFGHALKLPEGKLRPVDEKCLLDHQKGTREYHAPELVVLAQLAGKEKIEQHLARWKLPGAAGENWVAMWSEACDIYSAGYTAVQLAAGKWNFEWNSVDAILSPRTGLKRLLSHMIANNPTDRPRADVILADVALEDCRNMLSTKRKNPS